MPLSKSHKRPSRLSRKLSNSKPVAPRHFFSCLMLAQAQSSGFQGSFIRTFLKACRQPSASKKAANTGAIGKVARKSSNISTRQPAASFGQDKATFRNTYGAIVGGGVFIDSCKDCKVNNVNVKIVNTNTNGCCQECAQEGRGEESSRRDGCCQEGWWQKKQQPGLGQLHLRVHTRRSASSAAINDFHVSVLRKINIFIRFFCVCPVLACSCGCV